MSVVHQSVVPKEKERNIITQPVCIGVEGTNNSDVQGFLECETTADYGGKLTVQ